MDAAIPKAARNVVCAEAACELDSPNFSGFEPEEINKYLHSLHIIPLMLLMLPYILEYRPVTVGLLVGVDVTVTVLVVASADAVSAKVTVINNHCVVLHCHFTDWLLKEK